MIRLRAAPRVPVLLPLVEVEVNHDGHLSVQLDRQPFSTDTVLQRADLKQVVDGIATELGTPIRVAVQEADGSTFTDIVTAPAPASRPTEPVAAQSEVREAGGGFVPNEEIAIAFVVAHQIASSDGTAQLRLPAALREAHRGDVVLLGRTSGTIQVNDGLSLCTRAGSQSMKTS